MWWNHCLTLACLHSTDRVVCVYVCLYWQFKRTSSHYVDFAISGKNEYLQLFLDESHESIFFILHDEKKKPLRVFSSRGIIDGAYLLCENLYHSVYQIHCHHQKKQEEYKYGDEHEHWTTQCESEEHSSNKTNLVIILRSRQGTDIFIIIFVL